MPKQVKPSGTDPPSRGFESLDPKALQVFESTPQEMFIWDPSGNLLFANQRALDFHGFSLDRIRTTDFRSELYHPEDLPIVKEAIRKAVTQGEPLEVKARLLRHDGRYLWFLVRANPVRDENGHILQWYGALTDVDDEVRAEDLLRLTIDTTPAMVHTGEPDGGLDYFNQRWMEYLGVASKEMLGWRWTSVIHPDEVAAFVEKWRVSVRTGEPFQAESRVRRADGSYRWMIHRKVPLRDEQGNIIKWYGSSMDIDDLKHAEEDLRRSEAFLEEGQRISHTGSWVWKPATGEMISSKERFRIFGIEPEITEPSFELFLARVHPEDKPRFKEAFDAAVREKRGFAQEHRIVTPDGVIKHIHSVGNAILNESGELVEYIGSTVDITERKRAEERAQSHNEAVRLALNSFVEELDLNRFLGHVITGLTKQFQATASELWLFEDTSGTAKLFMTCEQGKVVRAKEPQPTGLPPRAKHNTWERSDIGRIPRIIELPAQKSLLRPAHIESLKHQGIKTLLLMPLVLGEQNLGFVEVRFPVATRLTPDDVNFAQSLIRHATLALQLSRLAHRTEQMAVTEERYRMAREIHDTLAQAFAGIVLHTEALKSSSELLKQRSKKALSQIEKLARSGLDEARRSVQALRPRALEDGTLPEALEQLAAQITKDAKLVCQFTQRCTARTLSTEVQDELFRIAQEAMTNVRKHAHAKSARINLESKLNRVILTVEDNGIGMSKNNPHTIKRGYGLASMRERAQHIGGRLEIDTHPGRGTKICVSVPLRARTEPTPRIT